MSDSSSDSPSSESCPHASKDFDAVIVICVIQGIRDQVIYVIERENRAWKKEGQIGVVFETCQEGELPDVTVRRGIKEELEVGEDDIELLQEKGKMTLLIQAEKGIIVARARIFLAQLREQTRITEIPGGSHELQGRGLIPVNLIMATESCLLRPGTVEALKVALKLGDQQVSEVIHVNGGVRVDLF